MQMGVLLRICHVFIIPHPQDQWFCRLNLSKLPKIRLTHI